jgi:hypothetical protein
VVDHLGQDHHQLPNPLDGVQRRSWEEDCAEGHYDRGTQDSFDQEDGEDPHAWGGSVCYRVLDH